METNLIGNTGIDPQSMLARMGGMKLEQAASEKDAAVAGRHFEAMLGTMLAQEMRKGLEEGFFGSGPGADTFGAWMDKFVGEAIADRGALKTADLVTNFAHQAQQKADAADAYTETRNGVLGGAQ